MFASRYVPSRKRSYSSSESESDGEEERKNEVVLEKESEEIKSDFIQEDTKNNDKIEKEEDDDDDNEEENDDYSEVKEDNFANRKSTDESEETSNEENPQISKHSNIFKRLKASINTNKDLKLESESEPEDLVEETDLLPIPQPELPKDKKLNLSYQEDQNLNWIAEPIYYSSKNTKPFEALFKENFKDVYSSNCKALLNNLTNSSFSTAFPVQLAVFKELITKNPNFFKLSPNNNNGDLLVNASTGSGKTLAYLIPLLLNLTPRVVPKLSCIILVPTRPLINQVLMAINALLKGLGGLNVLASNGNLSIQKELEKFENLNPDILISTPGRLVDYIEHLDLRYLKYFVIDEVDRLLNQYFQNWIQIINEKISKDKFDDNNNQFIFKVQKLLFSATLNNDVDKLSLLKFYNPKLLIINDDDQIHHDNKVMFTIPKKLSEFEIFFNKNLISYKPLILLKLLIEKKFQQNVLIFTNSNDASLRLTKLLNLLNENLNSNKHNNLKIQFLNSTINNNEKRKILNKFQSSKIGILIVTDLISRGIDLNNICQVINYDLPNSTSDYIHRIGRTARANNLGDAITLIFGNGERKWFNKLVKNESINRNSQNIDQLKLNYQISDEESKVYDKVLSELRKEII